VPIQGFPTAEARLVTDALERSLERVVVAMQPPIPGLGPVIRLFGPLGEALMWVVALDNHLRAADPTYEARPDADPHGQALLGLRFARNKTVHGVLVAAFFYGGAAVGLIQLGNAGLGQAPSCRWRPGGQLQAAHDDLREAYDIHVSGRELLSILNPAVAFLRSEAGT